MKGRVEPLLQELGFELTPVADSHLCCGSAGTYSVTQPELSEQLRNNKLKNLKLACEESGADEMPENLSDLQPIVKQFVDRMRTLEHEETTIREAKKDLVEEYSSKLDTKTLKLALRLMDLKKKVQHKHYFDMFVDILERDEP